MIPRRIWLNLAAFGLLFAALCVWAATTVLHLDIIERPYRVVASFESAPGVTPNIGVTYHGVQVGTVDGVDLETGQVDVALAIDRGVRLPRDLTAAVRRKSAVGEPYVALEPAEGYDGGGPYIEPGEDHVIPVGSTSVPVSYAELFTAIDELVTAVPEDDAVVVLDELATALGGRGSELRTIVESTADLTSTLAAESETLDAVASELTSLTHTVTERRDTLGTSFDNLAALTGALASSRADIERLLDEAPAFGHQVATLFEETVDELGCLFTDVGSLFGDVGSDENVANLVELLRAAPGAVDVLDKIFIDAGDHGADGPYLNGSFVPGVDVGEAPPLYDPRPTLPERGPALQPCAQRADSTAGRVGDRDASGSGEGGDAADPSSPAHAPIPGDASAPHPPSGDIEAGSQAFPLEEIAVALGLALLAAALSALRPWRYLRFGRFKEDR